MFKNDINLNLYKTFYDVARYGSFSKAAEFTYTTQSAISKSIKKLEIELETELFYRKSNGVELTEKGKELLFYVEKAFGNLLTAERALLERDVLNRGKLSIGIISDLYSYYLADKIIAFKKEYPKIEINIITGNTTYLLNQLDTHKIDFIIDMLPIEIFSNEYTINKLFDLHYTFISSKNNSITTIKDLKDEHVLLPLEEANNRKILNELLFKEDIELKNVTNMHTNELILSSVKKDMGIGYIIKELVDVDIRNKDIYELNLKENLPVAEVAIIYNKKFLTNAPKKFINNYITKI